MLHVKVEVAQRTLLPVGKRKVRLIFLDRVAPELVGNTCDIEIFPAEPTAGL